MLGEDRVAEVPPHNHGDEVTLAWLEPALRTLVETLVERLGLVGGEPGIDALSRRLAQLSNGDPLLLSLYAEDIAGTIMAALNMPRRVLWPELAVFANNPWKED